MQRRISTEAMAEEAAAIQAVNAQQKEEAVKVVLHGMSEKPLTCLECFSRTIPIYVVY